MIEKYRCQIIGCGRKNAEYIDYSWRCFSHKPIHCHKCKSVNVRKISDSDRVRTIQCNDCGQLTTTKH